MKSSFLKSREVLNGTQISIGFYCSEQIQITKWLVQENKKLNENQQIALYIILKPEQLVNTDEQNKNQNFDNINSQKNPKDPSNPPNSNPPPNLQPHSPPTPNPLCLLSPLCGKISHLTPPLTPTPANQLLFLLTECQHPVVLNNLCASCGQKTNQESLKQVPGQCNNFRNNQVKFSEEMAMEFERKLLGRLGEQGKLVLIIDLDNTVLHSKQVGINFDVARDLEMGDGGESCEEKVQKKQDIEKDLEYLAADKNGIEENIQNPQAINISQEFQNPYDFYTKPPKLQPKSLSHLDIYEICKTRNSKFITKLRPFLFDFFLELKDLYEIYIYTMGDRIYAETICELLNQQFKRRKEFGSYQIDRAQIISRNDNLKYGELKSLENLFPFSKSRQMILDDRSDVWNHCSNLVPTEPYHYFLEENPKQQSQIQQKQILQQININQKYTSNNENSDKGNDFISEKNINKIIEKDQNKGSDQTQQQIQKQKIIKPHDSFLKHIITHLKILHTQYFSLQNPDIRDLNQKRIKTLFENITIIFTGILGKDEQLEQNYYYKVAKYHGAKITTQIPKIYSPKKITDQPQPRQNQASPLSSPSQHVILTLKWRLTAKVRQGLQQNIKVLHVNWLLFSAKFLKLLDQDMFEMGNQLDQDMSLQAVEKRVKLQ